MENSWHIVNVKVTKYGMKKTVFLKLPEKTKWVDSYNKVLRRMTHRRVLCQTFMLGYANTKPSYSNKRCREPE